MNPADVLRPVAKAVAAALVPFVLLAAGWLTEQTGVDVAVDADALEALIVAAVTAAAVYLIPNRPNGPTPTEEQNDG